PMRDPLLERVLLPVGADLPPQVAQDHEDGLPDAEAEQRVERLEGVVEESVVVEDPRQARATKEFAAQHFLPDLVHLVHLGEEPMPAHVEMEALVVDRAGEAADPWGLFDDGGVMPEFEHLAARGESGRATADDDDVSLGWRVGHETSFTGVTPSNRSTSDRPMRGRGWARVKRSVPPTYRESIQ